MRFKAKGKGPLELPRLTNLGPMSQSSRDIGDLIFRGSNIEDLNSDEFKDNNIDGRPVDIWILDTAAVVKRYNLETETALGRHRTRYFNLMASNSDAEQAIIDEFRIGDGEINRLGVDVGIDYVPIERLNDNGLIARHISEQVTGGLSTNVGAGFRFAGTGGTDLETTTPLVLFLERNRIPARLTKVKYNEEFINEHPELAGAADSGGRMAMAPSLTKDFELDRFTAWYGVSSRPKTVKDLKDEDKLRLDVQEDALLLQWFDNPLSNFKQLEPEQELFAHTSEIDLDNALFGVCLYTGRQRLERMYKHVAGDPENVSIRNQVEAVHKEVSNRMRANSERLVTCVLKGQIRTSHKKVRRSSFHSFYDGSSFTTDYTEAIPFTDPTKF